MGAIENLTAEVARVKTVQGSAAALLKGLADKFDAAIATGDLSAVQDAVDEVRASTDDLSKAVETNTR